MTGEPGHKNKITKGQRVSRHSLPTLIKEINDCLAENVSGLSKEFFEDVRLFNNSFSRASTDEIENEEEIDAD